MEAYIAHDAKTGDEKMSDLEPLYEKALEGCTKEKFILVDVAGKIDQAKARPDWDDIKRQVFREDKTQIHKWFEKEIVAWRDEAFYVSGQYAGKIENDFVSKAT